MFESKEIMRGVGKREMDHYDTEETLLCMDLVEKVCIRVDCVPQMLWEHWSEERHLLS